MVGAYVASTSEEMEWNVQGKGITIGHFISSVKGCAKKCMTRFRIDGRTIKSGKLVYILVI
jgi:hypothetical protein